MGQVADVLKLDSAQRQALLADRGRTATESDGRAAGTDGLGGRAARLRVSILGPLMIVRDGEVEGGLSGAAAALLGLLALSVNRTVSRHAIVDALWGEDPPRSAIGIVHTYVSRLRSVLAVSAGPDGGSLVRDRLGYRLDLADDQLDVLEFRHLVESARRARADGDAAQACRAYEQALALWRGEPLADIDILRGHPAVIALADEVGATVLEYADFAASGRDGWPDRVLPHLRALTARDRLDETSHARLMMALAAGGRQAEALRIYEDLRQRLDEQMGVLPGAEVREVHARILRQEIPGWGEGAAQITRLLSGPFSSCPPPRRTSPAARRVVTRSSARSARVQIIRASRWWRFPARRVSGRPRLRCTPRIRYAISSRTGSCGWNWPDHRRVRGNPAMSWERSCAR